MQAFTDPYVMCVVAVEHMCTLTVAVSTVFAGNVLRVFLNGPCLLRFWVWFSNGMSPSRRRYQTSRKAGWPPSTSPRISPLSTNTLTATFTDDHGPNQSWVCVGLWLTQAGTSLTFREKEERNKVGEIIVVTWSVRKTRMSDNKGKVSETPLLSGLVDWDGWEEEGKTGRKRGKTGRKGKTKTRSARSKAEEVDELINNHQMVPWVGGGEGNHQYSKAPEDIIKWWSSSSPWNCTANTTHISPPYVQSAREHSQSSTFSYVTARVSLEKP